MKRLKKLVAPCLRRDPAIKAVTNSRPSITLASTLSGPARPITAVSGAYEMNKYIKLLN